MYRTSLICAFALVATGASAWTFAETNICTLSHTENGTEVLVTFDPATAIYAISITAPENWQQATVFQIRFDGPSGLTIGTDQHKISPDGRSLSVSDTGFGNVLAGIGRNTEMTALLGEQSVRVSTEDAAAPVAAFEACPSAPTS